ncbi:MAG: hypothetical protein ACP5NS_04840, partial [Candidatus Pacearchaeota archaeon]
FPNYEDRSHYSILANTLLLIGSLVGGYAMVQAFYSTNEEILIPREGVLGVTNGISLICELGKDLYKKAKK